MRFLLDAQLPPRLAAKLTAAGYEASHLIDHLPGYASDQEVALLAASLGAVLVSKDADFLDMALQGHLPVPFLWIRSGNMTTLQLWALFEPLLPRIVSALEDGQTVIEVR